MNVASVSGDRRIDDVVALWDTGSEDSSISQAIAEQLGLKCVAWRNVRYGDGRICKEPVYSVRVAIQPSDRFITVCVNGFTDEAQGFIIGMDLIRHGRFLLEPTDNGGVRFTFTV